MTTFQTRLLFASLTIFSAAASGADINAEYQYTQASEGFGRIQLGTVSVGERLADWAVTGLLQYKDQAAGDGSTSETGVFGELIVNGALTERLYSITRLGLTNNVQILIDDAAYQEFGYKLGKLGPVFIDGNAGLGTRRFPGERETYWNAGFTLSWADGALWLRREQSASGLGWVNLATLQQSLTEQLATVLLASNLNRSSAALPGLQGAVPTEVEGWRLALSLKYQIDTRWQITAGVDKVRQTRVDNSALYYDPLTALVALGYRL